MREYCREKGSNVEFEKLDPKKLDELFNPIGVILC